MTLGSLRRRAVELTLRVLHHELCDALTVENALKVLVWHPDAKDPRTSFGSNGYCKLLLTSKFEQQRFGVVFRRQATKWLNT